MSLFVQFKENVYTSTIRKLRKLNKELDALNLEDSTPDIAEEGLSIFVPINELFNYLLDEFPNADLPAKYKKEILPVLNDTRRILCEFIEALEILADRESMDELNQ